MDVRVKKETTPQRNPLSSKRVSLNDYPCTSCTQVIIKAIILICILREMFLYSHTADRCYRQASETARSSVHWFTCLKVSVYKVSVGDSTLEWVSAECSYCVLPPHFYHHSGLRRCSMANVPDQQSCFCFSGPLPITSDAACPPYFCGLEVFRRAEAAASSVFFSATFWDTGARNARLWVSSSAPQVSISVWIYHCWPLCMLQNAASSSPAPPSSFYSPPSIPFSPPLPSFLSARVFNSAPQADSPDGLELWESSSPSLQSAGIAGVSYCASLLSVVFRKSKHSGEYLKSYTEVIRLP